MGLTRMELYLNHERPLTENELGEFKSYIKRTIMNEPAQYIVGHQEFWSLDFKVTSDVLIPRADTETLVEALLDDIRENESAKIDILEIGTGSGAISVSVAHALKDERKNSITAVDISESALGIAKENAATNAVGDAITFIHSDMFKSIDSDMRFDYIVSNPPYIAHEFYEALDKKVKDFEPKLALYADDDGMQYYAEIFLKGCEYLKENGKIFIEIDYRKKKELAILASANSYSVVGCYKDISGHDRVLELIKRG